MHYSKPEQGAGLFKKEDERGTKPDLNTLLEGLGEELVAALDTHVVLPCRVAP